MRSLAAVLVGALAVASAGCWPEHATVVPDLKVRVTDQKGRPIRSAKVLMVTKQYPHTEVRRRSLARTDGNGRTRFSEERRWVTQAAILPHGVVYHHVDVCVTALGYQPNLRRVETKEIEPGKTLAVALTKGETTNRCWTTGDGIRIGDPARLNGVEILQPE